VGYEEEMESLRPKRFENPGKKREGNKDSERSLSISERKQERNLSSSCFVPEVKRRKKNS